MINEDVHLKNLVELIEIADILPKYNWEEN